MSARRVTVPVHPLLFVVYLILTLYAYNLDQMYLREVFLPAAVVLGATLLLFVLARVVSRNLHKAAALTSFSVLLFFLYGHCYNLVVGYRLNDVVIGRHKYLFIVWVACLGLGWLAMLLTRRSFLGVTRWLNVVGVCAVGMSIFSLTTHVLAWSSAHGSFTTGHDAGTPSPPTQTPDIYYIVLDGYAGSPTLREMYGFDNREFLEWLKEKGFFVVPDGRSNYATTGLSLASSLNFDYLRPVDKRGARFMVGGSRGPRALIELIQKNRAWQFLKPQGYRFVHFDSGWGATVSNQFSDVDFRYGYFNEFVRVLIRTTMLAPFTERFTHTDMRNSILYTFEKLQDIPFMPEPTFTLAHIVTPHPPYLFDRRGGAVHVPPDQGWRRRDLYVDQLIYVNTKVQELVELLFSRSDVPPIIIFQGDHGPASTWGGNDAIVPSEATPAQVYERIRILNAYYLPDAYPNLLYETITPANTFRVIFNAVFDAGYELLEDQTNFSTYGHMIDFVIVKATD